MINFIDNKKMLVVPAFLSFIITTILLYKYSYPISWDVYYHIHMTNLYLNNGLVFWDYFTVAPKGRLIMYPPLFHLFLGVLCKLFNVNAFAISWLCQPFFAFFLIFTITYASNKLFKNVPIAVCTGFLAMLSFTTFNRSVICTPANLAIVFFMLSCLFFYESFKEDDIYKCIFSAFCLGIICNLHMATFIITVGVLGLYTLYLIYKKEINFKYLTCFGLILLISLSWWIYIFINYNLVFNSVPGSQLRIDEFLIKYYGIIPSVSLIFGFIYLLKNKSDVSIFLTIWSLSIVFLSQVYWFGVETVSIRIFEVSAYPLILIAGYGLYNIFSRLKNYKLKYILIILFIGYSLFASICYVDSYTPDLMVGNESNETLLSNDIHLVFDPVGTIIKPSIISDRYASDDLAKSRYDVVSYFTQNNNVGIIVSEDAIMDTIIVSSTNYSVIYGGFTESIPEYVVDPVHIVNNNSNLNELHSLNISYILLKKQTPIPNYANKVYENDYYIICKVIDD